MAFLGGADTRGGSRGALKRAQAWDQGQCSVELEDPVTGLAPPLAWLLFCCPISFILLVTCSPGRY